MPHPETGDVLIVRNPSTWSFPAGKVEPGETFREAAVRETLEETSVTVRPLGILLVTERHPFEAKHDLFITFAAEYIGGEPDPSGDDGVSEALWVPPSRADDLVDFLPLPVADLLAAFPGVMYEIASW